MFFGGKQLWNLFSGASCLNAQEYFELMQTKNDLLAKCIFKLKSMNE